MKLKTTFKIDKTKYPFCFSGHEYAKDVVSGKIVAGKYIIGSCERYLSDLEKDDSFYFDIKAAEKYLRLVQKFQHTEGHWPTKNIVYSPWQNWVFMNIMGFKNKATGFRRFRTSHLEVARGNAKLHPLDTLVPTPDGIKIWKDIEVGSRLYDRSGNICTVIGKTPIYSPQLYEITFSDGSKIKASDKHLWFTKTKVERTRETRHFGRKLRKTKTLNTSYESVRTTEDIFKTINIGGSRGGKVEVNHSVSNTLPIIGEKKNLPIDPYVFGYWLGNGTTGLGSITCHAKDADEVSCLFEQRGFKENKRRHKKGSQGVTISFEGLAEVLKNNSLGSKDTIPEDYFLSVIEDRLEFVRGLLDSDGTINPSMSGKTGFTAKRKLHADGLARLLYSLGYKIHRSTFKVPPTNNFKSDSLFNLVSFYPRGTTKVFNLERKSSQQIDSIGKHGYTNRRYITGCEKLKKRSPGFCVEVDSPDKSYLIGEGYIPTHNSTMSSQTLLYFLALDNPNGNSISTVATKRDQARIVLDSARAMARKNNSFLKHTGVEVLAHSIIHRDSNSVARALSSDHGGMDGLKDVLAICDELHAMTRLVFEVIYSGMSKRKDSLLMCITTAGSDTNSVGYFQSVYAKKVSTGEVQDEAFFSAVYTLDDEDDWADENVWIKANPGLGVSVDLESLRAKVEKALVSPSDISNIRIKHMNQWIAEANAFYDLKVWDDCADPSLKIEDFKGKSVRLGLDLASHVDITSIGYIFKEKDVYYIFDKSYLPEETVKAKNNAFYENCLQDGSLIQTKGAAINYEKIQEQITEDTKTFRVEECMYDAWNATELAQRMSDKVEMVKVPMNTANLSEPMKKFDSLMRSGKIKHNGSKLLRWCVGNVIGKEDHNGNVFPRKSYEKMKIDPVVALLLALAGWVAAGDDGESVYEVRGIRKL